MSNPLLALQDFDQSLWYDNIHRGLLASGEMSRMIQEDGLKGITSNPAIFHKAITGGDDYDPSLAELLRREPQGEARDLFYHLAVDDIRAAADLLRPVHDHSGGRDGFVSLEVSPDLAYDTAATVDEARRLFRWVDRPNCMIKVPATRQGLSALETLIAEGIPINVTLLFAIERYQEVAEAYRRGLQQRLEAGQDLNVASVASFFVSRVDTLVDKWLTEQAPATEDLRGRAAIANAKLAYQHYQTVFTGDAFAELRANGARPQRLLWASTGTKAPQRRDVLYIESLIGADTVTTVPPGTYEAFKDHGQVASTLEAGVEGARQDLARLAEAGIDLRAATEQLEGEGVKLFADAFTALMEAIDDKARALRQRPAAG